MADTLTPKPVAYRELLCTISLSLQRSNLGRTQMPA